MVERGPNMRVKIGRRKGENRIPYAAQHIGDA